MSDVVVLYAHPNPRRSRLNRHLAEAAAGVKGVSVRDLYERYPNLYVNAEAERGALEDARAVVFQFPIYWFSAPALMKEWQDSVLSKGFAFGPGGTSLEGKRFMLAVTTGGSPGSYAAGQPHGATVETYFAPFEQTARFCGMVVEQPFVVHDVGGLDAGQVADTVNAYRDRLARLVMGGRS